jgi:hypothetical protein
MHLFSFVNEEDKEASISPGLNKCKMNLNLVESMFCSMARLSSSIYAEKWKSIPRSSEYQLVIVFYLINPGEIVHK